MPCDICKAEDCRQYSRVPCHCPCHLKAGQKRSFDRDIARPIRTVRKNSHVLQTWRDRRPHAQFYRAWAIVTRNPQISRQELAHALGLSSPSPAQYWITRLEEAGVIQRKGARGIEILIPFAYQKPKRRR